VAGIIEACHHAQFTLELLLISSFYYILFWASLCHDDLDFILANLGKLQNTFFYFGQYWGLNSGPHTCYSCYKPLCQPCFVVGIFEIGSLKLSAWVALNLDPSDLCLPSS
jgi:hypothetical protein